MAGEQRSYDLQRLLRWQDSGATWRLLSVRQGTVTISLCRCDDESEEVDRLVSDAPDLIEYAVARDAND
ncbi:MAG: hypothetical protein J2P23_08105 [Microlunatus sp.]|nr:hypothetical protein [Microlunatus sp.]